MGEELGLGLSALENSGKEHCTHLFIFQLSLFSHHRIVLTLSSKCEEAVHAVLLPIAAFVVDFRICQ